MSELSEQQRDELRDWWDDGGDFSVDDWGPATLFPIVARMIAQAEQRGYARGAAEQAAKVEALASEWESLPEPPDEDYEGMTEGHWAFGEWLATIRAAKQLRADLASEGTDTLAKVRADALRAAANEAEAVIADGDVAEVAAYVPGEVGRSAVIERRDALYEEPHTWLREYADRIEAGDAR